MLRVSVYQRFDDITEGLAVENKNNISQCDH